MHCSKNDEASTYTKQDGQDGGKSVSRSRPSSGREEHDGAQGLSTAHITSQPSTVELWIGASKLKVTKAKSGASESKGGGLRGQATFSKSSRRRLLRKLAEVKRSAMPIFVTLTYPAEWPHSPGVWKRHLDKFCARLMRRWHDAGFFWKLEPQKRGAPHFHLMVWGVSYLDLLMWVSRAWFEVVDSGDTKHLRAGTRVEEVRSVRGVFAYASKYLGKVVEQESDIENEGWSWSDGGVGRFWGVRGHIPWGSLAVVAVSYPEAVRLLRLLRRAIRARGRDYPSLTGIVNADYWAARLPDLVT